MLSNAIRRRERGEDVVIGVIETHERAPAAEPASKLDAVQRRHIEWHGTIFREMNVISGGCAIRGVRKYLHYWSIQRFLQDAPFIDIQIITQE